MLDRQILRTDYGVSYGSVTLKSLQNDNIPEIDLLVREAIQNSSDAALEEDGNSYAVNFQYGAFETKAFNIFLTDIEAKLNELFPGTTADYLEIRDTKTSGLTGCIRKNEIKKDDHGNFFKLIYDTGKRQTKSSAGGNWGFGKSVYYRVGIGIVIFYSRIKTEDGYDSRLIITLVEDEGKKDSLGNDATILNSIEPLSAGKAWWGMRDGEDLLPLRDMEFITSVLDVFGLAPFKDTETGTSIIIPYLKSPELLGGILPADAEIEAGVKDHFKNVWTSSIPDYLKLAIERWSAPKIHNRELPKFCDKKWLMVSVNHIPIRKQDMLPVFRLIQELYLTSIAKTYSYDYTSSEFPEIKCMPVNIMGYFSGKTSGYVSMIKISKSELNGTQNLLSPYDYIGKFEADGGLNEPIVMYARDPGMVIEYAVTGPWVKNITPPESPDDFIFAFYFPDTEKLLRQDLSVPEFAGIKLGEYLRECEASDHMGWNDPVKMQIVQRIQRNTVNQITGQLKKVDDVKVDATASKLSNRLGKNLLPRVGYGKKSGGSGGSGGGGTGTKITNVSLEISSQTIYNNEVVMDYVLKLMHGKKVARVSLLIASEGGWIDPEAWNNDIGTDFPMIFNECSLSEITTSVAEHTEINQSCTATNPFISVEEADVSLGKLENKNQFTSVVFQAHVLNPTFSGKVRIRAYDKKYKFSFKLE